jgi:hypothetical protein
MIKKSKLYQYFFLIMITLMVIFNGGNNNLYIQFNFIIISIFFLSFIREKNYTAHGREIFSKNKLAILLYSLFISFLIFQTIPLPIEWIDFLSPEKYNILKKLDFNDGYTSISLNPSNSFFGLLNYLSIFLYLIIFKSVFYRNKDIFKFYYFLVFLGAFAASVAIYFYLIGNPDFMILKNKISPGSATGFFINRTVFSCFLTLCFFSGIEYLKKIDDYKKGNTDKFFNKIYVRIFILLITIGIITTFSKLGNFLFISIVILYILQAFFINDKKSKFFLITLILIVLVDILILGFYFGSEKLLQRYLFLQNDIIEYLPSAEQSFLSRADIVKFALVVSKKFVFWGYGGGGFEYLFKINFENLSTVYASHVHSDIIEFIGEFGLIGFTLILLSLLFSCIKKNFFSFKNILLLYLLLFILIFDFSFHIPLIQLLFILLLSMNYNKSYILSRKNNE